MIFRCYLAGDDVDADDDDNDDAIDNDAMGDSTATGGGNHTGHRHVGPTVNLRVPPDAAKTQSVLPGGDGQPDAAADDVRPCRYRVHVVCHDVGMLPRPVPDSETAEAKVVRQQHERILCIRTFFFTRQ